MNNNHYEITVIYNGMLEDDQVKPYVDQTVEMIGRHGGTIKSTDVWGRRRLAYPIEKKNNGYYIQFTVEGPGEMVHHLERFFHIEENVMRHLILQFSQRDLQRREEAKEKHAAAAAAEAAARAAEEAAAAGGADDED